MPAGRYLAANGFAGDRDHAIFRYTNSGEYVSAINDYAAVIASDPATYCRQAPTWPHSARQLCYGRPCFCCPTGARTEI
jgi:hypothetical protein